MIRCKKEKIGSQVLESVVIDLGEKKFILLRGRKGYVACGYLDMKVAEKFGDVAVGVQKVSSIADVLTAKVHSMTSAARAAGIRKNQVVKEIIDVIA